MTPVAVSSPVGRRRLPLLVATALATLLFVALAVWQVERRAWKLALIAAVAERVRAAPVPPPPPARWATVSRAADEYRHVAATGRLIEDRETLVQALTEAGPGYWVMTPLRADGGVTILVNRGFVPAERRGQATRRQALPLGPVRIVGLLRTSEPGGSLLRSNRPDRDLWYSRDVAAIARRRGLDRAAPFFIDADATPNPGGWPLGGLTVVAFPNNHLIYAITWGALALLSAGAFVIVWRERR